MSNAPALKEPRDSVKSMRATLENPKVVKGIKSIVPKFVTPERMLRICANAIEKNPLLAECSQSSFLGAVMASAALGLEPNTLAGHAYLIPYKTKRKVDDQWVDIYECQFQMGYKGYIELAYRNETCVAFSGLPVFSNDHFRHYIGGDLSELTVEYEAARSDRGELEGAFALAVYERDNGARGRTSLYMPEEEIAKVRACSQTYNYLLSAWEKVSNEKNPPEWKLKKAKKAYDETPWVAWAPDMYAKSAIRKLAKQLPIFGNLMSAANIEERSEMGDIDMDAMSDPDTAKAVTSGEEEPPMIEHQEIPDDQRPPLAAVPDDDEPAPKAQSKKAEAKKAPAKKAEAETPASQDNNSDGFKFGE